MWCAGVDVGLAPPLLLPLAPAPQVVRYTDANATSALTTLRAFAGASGVVGYHGAGLVNVVFALAPLCVLEISTLMMDEDDPGCEHPPPPSMPPRNTSANSSTPKQPRSKFQPWRTNGKAVSAWTPFVYWNTYWLATSTVLRASHVPCELLTQNKVATRDRCTQMGRLHHSTKQTNSPRNLPLSHGG